MSIDKSKHESWSERYKSRTDGLKEPAGFIKDNIDQLKKGTVLDLACGDGRNAIFLAKEGFEVTGVDFSQEALKRLDKFSEIEEVEVKTQVVDVEDESSLLNLGSFDNIVISNYKPSEDIFKVLPEILSGEGRIVFVTFNFKQSQTSEFPRKYCLEEDEFKDVSDKLELVKLESLIEKDKHLDGYVFKLK